MARALARDPGAGDRHRGAAARGGSRDPYDGGLIALALAYSTTSMLAFARSRRLQRSPAAWPADTAAVLALIAAAQDWRSPFYLLGLTALVLPATTLPFRRARMFGFAYTAGYLAVAIARGPRPGRGSDHRTSRDAGHAPDGPRARRTRARLGPRR